MGWIVAPFICQKPITVGSPATMIATVRKNIEKGNIFMFRWFHNYFNFVDHAVRRSLALALTTSRVEKNYLGREKKSLAVLRPGFWMSAVPICVSQAVKSVGTSIIRWHN